MDTIDRDDLTYFSMSWLREDDDHYYDDIFDAEYMAVRKKHIDSYSAVEQVAIREKCQKAGKEDPWSYRARKEREGAVWSGKTQMIIETKEEKQIQAELPSVKKASQEFKISLQQARTAAGLKQKDLAAKVKVTANVIGDWEAGRSLPNGVQRGLLNKALKTVLPKA